MAKYTSDDVRKTVAAYFKAGSYRNASRETSVPKSTIHVWVKRIGKIINDKRRGCKKARKETNNKCAKIKLLVSTKISENPYNTIVHVHLSINHEHQIRCSLSTVRRVFKSLGLSRKRASRIMNPDPEKREAQILDFKERIKSIPVTDVLSVDETSIDSIMRPHYGWCTKGQRLECGPTPKARNRISFICGIACDGVKGGHFVEGSGNTNEFKRFLNSTLPHCPQTYVLMDNISFHKSKDVLQIINDHGKIPIFTPAYCPKHNPVEHAFSSLKKLVRDHRVSAIDPISCDDLKVLIDTWKLVGPLDWTRTFVHCLRNV